MTAWLGAEGAGGLGVAQSASSPSPHPLPASPTAPISLRLNTKADSWTNNNRAHPTTDASDVLVTGSFDGWTKSVQLEKKGDVFQKTVEFSDKDAVNKIYYKVSGQSMLHAIYSCALSICSTLCHPFVFSFAF